MPAMLTYVWIALGGAIGTLLRFWLNLVLTSRFGETLPWGTIAINITGSFAIGLFAALSETGGRLPVSTDMRLFVLVGLCGGFTTFSSFSLQTLALFQAGEPARAIANVLLSVLCCLVAVWIGFAAPNALARLFRS
jgi:CrcB protein